MGLFRTAARAAVATKVVGNVHRRQSRAWAAQEDAQAQAAAQAAPPPTAPASAAPLAPVAAAPVQDTDAMIRQLTELGKLRDQGILTPEEFEAQKSRVLAGS